MLGMELPSPVNLGPADASGSNQLLSWPDRSAPALAKAVEAAARVSSDLLWTTKVHGRTWSMRSWTHAYGKALQLRAFSVAGSGMHTWRQ